MDGFIWIIQRDGATQVNSLLAGETHIADTIDGNDIERVESEEGYVSLQQQRLFYQHPQDEYARRIHQRYQRAQGHRPRHELRAAARRAGYSRAGAAWSHPARLSRCGAGSGRADL